MEYHLTSYPSAHHSSRWKLTLVLWLGILVVASGGFAAGWWSNQWYVRYGTELISPWIESEPAELPLQKYSLTSLQRQTYTGSDLTIVSELTSMPEYTAYVFTYQTSGGKVSGQINIPTTPAPAAGYPVIVMSRGYVPQEQYSTGVGTKNAAAALAKQGYVTLAPDFLGFGLSDPEPSDSWEARFIKPVTVLELLASVETKTVTLAPDFAPAKATSPQLTVAKIPKLDSRRIGLWGHSNGGQITLTVLEILGKPLPTTLWAPVTAPFPYSILFFSDEVADEGKSQRAWLAMFERDYDVFDFTLTKHLDRLRGPLQIHHGISDEAALISWSDEFADKIKAENKRREQLKKERTTMLSASSASATPTSSASPIDPAFLEPIVLTYHRYPDTDHNLQPNWQTVVDRDSAFFRDHL